MESLHEKLLHIQSNLVAPKGQYNAFGKYKYRSCEDILEVLKPALKAMGCSLTISDDIINLDNRFYIVASVTISDGKDSITTKAMAREPSAKKGMDESQITGAASSYARKYALNGMFAIDDSKDADSTNEHGKSKEAPAQTIKKTPSDQHMDLINKLLAKITKGFKDKNKITMINQLCDINGYRDISDAHKIQDVKKLTFISNKLQQIDAGNIILGS